MKKILPAILSSFVIAIILLFSHMTVQQQCAAPACTSVGGQYCRSSIYGCPSGTNTAPSGSFTCGSGQDCCVPIHTGPVDACKTETLGDGFYCGGAGGVVGSPGSLFHCVGKITQPDSRPNCGCAVCAVGPDVCGGPANCQKVPGFNNSCENNGGACEMPNFDASCTGKFGCLGSTWSITTQYQCIDTSTGQPYANGSNVCWINGSGGGNGGTSGGGGTGTSTPPACKVALNTAISVDGTCEANSSQTCATGEVDANTILQGAINAGVGVGTTVSCPIGQKYLCCLPQDKIPYGIRVLIDPQITPPNDTVTDSNYTCDNPSNNMYHFDRTHTNGQATEHISSYCDTNEDCQSQIHDKIPCAPRVCNFSNTGDGHCEHGSGFVWEYCADGSIGHQGSWGLKYYCGAFNVCCQNSNGSMNPNQQLASRVLGISMPPKALTATITAVNPPLAYTPTASNVLGVQAYKATSTVSYDAKQQLYVNPYLILGNIPSGTYNMFVHIDKFLDAQLVQTTGSKTFTVPKQGITQVTKMIPGDIAPAPHGDNIIDIQDYNAMIACMQKDKSCTNPSQADLNWDGVVDQADLDLLISHFGAEGASFEISQFTCVTDPACAKKSTNTIQLCPLKCTKQIPK